jgi:hypothetical protein
LVLFLREVLPAGQRIELEGLLDGVLAWTETLASVPGGELLSAVESDADWRVSL